MEKRDNCCLNRNCGNTDKLIKDKLHKLGMEKYWLIGFVEGEGSFLYVTQNGIKFPKLIISQKDKEILLKIKEFFGCGNVYLNSPNGVYEYRMARIKDLIKVVKFFDKKLITKAKKEQFEKWKAVVILKNKNYYQRSKK